MTTSEDGPSNMSVRARAEVDDAILRRRGRAVLYRSRGNSLLDLWLGRLAAEHDVHRRTRPRPVRVGGCGRVGNRARQDDAHRLRPVPARVPRGDSQGWAGRRVVQPSGRGVQMKITVIVNADGHVTGATAVRARPETRAGHPSAWLVAGPGQRLVEVEVADDVVPHPDSSRAEIER